MNFFLVCQGRERYEKETALQPHLDRYEVGEGDRDAGGRGSGASTS